MNWGNKLLITFVVFSAGISYLVYRSTHVTYELVENDYYKKELRYQQVIDGANSANSLKTAIGFSQSTEGVRLQLPAEMQGGAPVTGNIWFYCAYNSHKDRKFDLKTNESGSQLFPLHTIEAGRYTVKVSWSESGKNYYTEKDLTVL